MSPTAMRASSRPSVARLLAALCLLAAGGAYAQDGAPPPELRLEVSPPPDLPSARPLEPPPLAPSDEAESPAPAVPVPAPPEAGFAPLQPRVLVRQIEIRGNSVLPPELVARVASGYVDRGLDAGDLEVLRRDLSRLYQDAGFVTSLALLPDQDFESDTLRVVIVEGRLGRVEVAGARGFRAGYLEARVRGRAGEVLNIHELERRLQLLRRDPRIESVRAELRQGLRTDESVLALEIREGPRQGGSLDVNNYQSPAIGALNGRVGLTFSNLHGHGDQVWGSVGASEGLVDVELLYRSPLNRFDTRLDARFRYSDSRIVDEAVAELDIATDYLAGALSLAQPILRSASTQLELGLQGEWRRSRSTLDGFDFSFTDAADQGRVQASVLRFYQDLVYQRSRQVFAARSTWSFGLDVLGATSGSVEQADFVTWLGQLQWIRRFEPSGVELFARGNVQLAFDPLVPFERFSVGGRYSVRGYRENQAVRDSGYSIGLEARYPLLRAPDGRALLQLVPFFDLGRAWSRGRAGFPPAQTLAGAGLGLVWRPRAWLQAEIFYGSDIWDVPETGSRDLQDHGVQFRIVVASF